MSFLFSPTDRTFFDLFLAILFFIWYEALSLPLRLAISGSPAPADVRRLLSRLAGPPLLLLPIWFGGHLSGLLLRADFGRAWFVLLLAAGGWIALRRRSPAAVARGLGFEASPRSEHLAFDLMVFFLYLGLVLWRRWVPEMTTYVIDSSAAEKFMNAMIWWSTWHAPSLPPQDYWLAGHPLTYYYWGHWHWAWIGRVGGFPGEAAITLAFARMATLVVEGAVLLGRACGLRLWGALLAGMAAAWGGNPSAVAMAWRCFTPQGFVWQGYDYWRPSRALGDNVVDEIPAFSAILGDFHAHHLSLGWLVAWFAMTIAAARWSGLASSERRAPHLYAWAAAWITLGIAAALSNMWNLPTLAAVLCGAPLVVFIFRRRPPRGFFALTLSACICILLTAVGIGLIRAGEALPLGEGSAAAQSLLARIPIHLLPANLRSTLPQLWSLWGFAVAPIAVAALFRAPLMKLDAGSLLFLGGLLSALLSYFTPYAFLIWPAVFLWIASLSQGFRPWLSTRSALLGGYCCLMLLFLELAFIDDAMAGGYERYNTYFKLSYPVWPVLMVVATQAALAPWKNRCRWRLSRITARVFGLAAAGVLAAWLLLLAIYPAFGLPARVARSMMGEMYSRQPTLNAFDFLQGPQRIPAEVARYQSEGEMLAWVRENIPPGEVIAEAAWVAPGETFVGAYNFGGRVASLGGRPVPLGWAGHERMWRGQAGMALTAQRQADLDRLYTAPDAESLRQAAAVLGVRYIYYGVLEADLYSSRIPRENRTRSAVVLGDVGRVVKRFGTIRLYDIAPPSPR